MTDPYGDRIATCEPPLYERLPQGKRMQTQGGVKPTRARLGDVLYLAGCVLSLLWFSLAVIGGAIGALHWNLSTVIAFGIFLVAPAALFWSVGAACLYVLRGDAGLGFF